MGNLPLGWQIFFGALPLLVGIIGSAVHIGIKIGGFQQSIVAVRQTQQEMKDALAAHVNADERLFSDLNKTLRSYGDTMNRLLGAFGGKKITLTLD